MSAKHIRRVVGCAVLAAALAGTPCRAVAETPPAPLLADGWSIGNFVSGANSRTRVVQICTAVMCLGLVILMRKFNT